MGFKPKQILLKFDFIGPFPEFRILNETRYKSIFSSILSILLIIFSIGFAIYSFYDYLHQIPKVEYYKNNDFSTNKTLVLSDTLLMFKYYFTCIDNLGAKVFPRIYFNTGLDTEYFTLEPCELGKNINLKYKEALEKFDIIEGWKYKEFYCVNYNGSNVTLFTHSSLTNVVTPTLYFKIFGNCTNYIFNLKFVVENDFINHTKKDDPIVPYYQRYDLLLNKEESLVFNYQYIKYESDNGIIFNDKAIYNGIGIFGANLFDKYDVSKCIIKIAFKMNNANYDFYRRTFQKFQSFLAEVMSLISLLITISKVITEFLLYKKMHKDIIKHIIINEEKEIIPQKKLKKIFDINDNKIQKFDKKIEQNQIIEEKANSKIYFETYNKDSGLDFENNDKNMIQVMKNLNFINILKSFLCFKDKKLKLINLCNDIVNKDICAERILKRLYILENEYNSLIEGDRKKSFIDNDISKVKNIIKRINKEANKQIKNKYGHLSKENNMIKK